VQLILPPSLQRKELLVRVYRLAPSGGHLKHSIDPSGLLFETNSGVRILVDFGMAQERFFDKENGVMKERPILPSYPHEPPHYVILSHMHMDHAGGIPLVMKKYPNAKLILTRPTLEIGRVAWSDHSKIMTDKHFPGLVPYSSSMYESMKHSAIIVDEPGWINLMRDVRVYLGPAGHMIGAAFVVIEDADGAAAFTGDASTEDTPILKGMSEEDVLPMLRTLRGGQINTLFIESTLGDRNVPSREKEARKARQAVRETFARGGKVLEVALAIGRAQEVLIDQVSRMKNGKVYLDSPMATEAWRIFSDPQKTCWSSHEIPISDDLSEKVFHLSSSIDGEFRNKILQDPRPYLIVASAGSLQGGKSAEWAKKILPDQRNTVILCNYQFEGTPGAALEKIEQGGTLFFANGESVRVKADVLRLEGLSAHAGADQLVSIARWFDARRTYPVHGVSRAKRALRRRLSEVGLQVGNIDSYRGESIKT